MLRYKLRTLLIWLAVLPPALAGMVLFPDIAILLAALIFPVLLFLMTAIWVQGDSTEPRRPELTENQDGLTPDNRP